MSEVDHATETLRSAGLLYTPPHVLVTRWLALLAGDEPIYLDVAHNSGKDVPGASYTFLAVTNDVVCYLHAEHNDEFWEQERRIFSPRPQDLAPRTLVAWRRPLTQVTEIGLGGDVWRWLPGPGEAERPVPAYVLTFGGESVALPLHRTHRQGEPPNPAPVVARITEAWRAS